VGLVSDTERRPAKGILFQKALTAALERWAAQPTPGHLCIAGPVGCGQGLTARNMAAFLAAEQHEPVMVKVIPGELAVAHPAEAIDRLRARWHSANGGVLHLTGLESLLADRNAVPMLRALRDLMASDPSVHVLISGDRESAAQLHALSPDLYLRLGHVTVTPFTPSQLVELTTNAVSRRGLAVEPGFRNRALPVLRSVRSVGDLANGRIADALARDSVDRALAAGRRNVKVADLDVRSLRTIEAGDRSALEDLEKLIGLRDVKTAVRQWTANSDVLLRREALGLHTQGMGQHMVFKGPAGTAKTTVARIVARVLAETGVLSSGHLVEVQRADLVGEHSEATTRRVVEAVKRALGGVLFVDEVYTLTSTDDGQRDASREVVDTLLKLMEDYRDEFVVVVAGYGVQTEQFLNSNPGLRSRFVRVLDFPLYEVEELMAILDHLASERGFRIDPSVHAALSQDVSIAVHYPGFGNGRHMRNLLEMAIVRQATRLTPESSDDDLRTLLAEDFREPVQDTAPVLQLG
jgi:SpoVK/Ycf46/Vps4 family AAA+-type ATPase